MHSLSFFILSACKTLLHNSYVAADGTDDLEWRDYDMFTTDDFSDPSTQSEFFPSDPLAQDDISLFTDPLSSNVISTSLLSSSDLVADLPPDGCTSSDSTQDQFFSKRLDNSAEDRTQMCLPRRNNPGKYPGFDPENDPLMQLKIKSPEDEEFCPRQLYFSSHLVCDSGYYVDRHQNPLTGFFNLDRCHRIDRVALGNCKEPKWIWCCRDFYVGQPPLGNFADSCDLWLE